MKRNIISAILLSLAIAPVAAQDLFLVEQALPEPSSSIIVMQGWDANMTQSSPDSARIAISSYCPDLYYSKQTPRIATITAGELLIPTNNVMPKDSRLNIHLPSSTTDVTASDNAKLSINNFNFDESTSVNASAASHVTMNNIAADDLHVSAKNGSNVIINGFNGRILHVWVMPEANVTLENINAKACHVHLHRKGHCNITQTDSAKHIFVHSTIVSDSMAINQFNLGISINPSIPIFNFSSRHASAYNTDFDLGLNLALQTNQIKFSNNFYTIPRMLIGYQLSHLSNQVATDGKHLVINSNQQQQQPLQMLGHWSISLPLGIGWQMPKKGSTTIPGVYLSIAPTFNFGNRLFSNNIDTDNKHLHTSDAIDVYRQFNLRASVNINLSISGLSGIELYTDLLPTFKSGIGAEGIRNAGLRINF